VNREFHSLVHGFGQSLELGVGPYNQIGDHRIAVAKAITDCGSIKSVSRRDDRWTLEFRHSIEPETARVVAWTGSGLILLPDPAIEWNCSYCHVASSFFGAAPVAFGVSFEGFCVGTGLTEGPPFSQLCCVIECSEDWVSAASCLRWFHLPLLDPHIRHSVASRIAGNECRTICIWTGSGGPPSPALRQEDANRDRWQYAVRSFFERWRPCPNDAGALIRHFELLSGDPGRDLNDCWERYDEVLNIHPVLMAGIANLGIATIYPGYPQARGIFIEMLQNVCLDLPRTAGGSDRQRAEQEYLDEAARSMGVDPAFIQRSLLTDAWDLCSGTPVKTRNLRIALAIRPFRQWLAARLLSNDAEHAI
jgi:hypothetical protein